MNRVQRLSVAAAMALSSAAFAEAPAGDSSIAQAVAQASAKSHYLAETGGSAGVDDKGFFIKQGDFSLRPGAQFQFRNVTNWRDGVKNDDANDIQNGFEVRRMKIWLAGSAFVPELSYYLRIASSRKDGTVSLEEAYADYKLSDQISLRMGQFKEPVHHEEMVSSTSQLAVDRSLLNELLGGGVTDYVQGVALMMHFDSMKAYVGFTDGAGNLNTNFEDNGVNFGLFGRVEFKAMGDWKDYRDFSTLNLKNDLLVIGGGLDFTQGDNFNALLGTVDAQFKTGAMSLYGAVLGAWTDPRNVGNDDSRFDWGLLGQVGYLVSSQVEVFARYDVTLLDKDFVTGEDTLHEMTVGLNYFLTPKAGHKAKFSIDATYLPNGGPSETGIGILSSEDAQFIIRGQFQLVI